jgi:lipid-binding SYLF domain-containing protein
VLATGLATLARSSRASAASARQLNQDASAALRKLFAAKPKARALSRQAKALLIFPKIVKAGLVIGGQSGDGVLWINDRADGYYNTWAASFGLQAGAQTFSYVLFFMTKAGLQHLKESNGWAIGSGPSVVVVDRGAEASVTFTALRQDVYAFPFGERGLMAGLDLEGSKITRINPS